MNVYAVSWVMGSPVDSHVKALFAQNPSLSLVGFIFPEAWIPTLDGVPIYSFSNAPINRNDIYVDFSFAQKLSREAVAWSNANEVEVISLAAWLNLLATGTEPVKSSPRLDGIPLKLVKELKIDRRSIDRLSPASRKNAVDILEAYQQLNFRDLHKKSQNMPNEEYIQEVVRLFTRNMRGGCINVHVLDFDEIAVHLCKVHFTFREMQRLRVYQPDGTVYEVLGRDQNPTPVSVHFAKSSEIITIDGFLEKEVYLLIRLENGLIDIPKILQWLDGLSASIQSINFTQTTSRLIDSFIACRLIWSDSVGPAFVDLQ